MDYVNEIGESLEKFLKEFKKYDTIYPEQKITKDLESTQDMFFALTKRGFIVCPNKEITCRDDIELSDRFQITIEGNNYLELRSRWWSTFRMRTFIIPIIVSFVSGSLAPFLKDTLLNVCDIFSKIMR